MYFAKVAVEEFSLYIYLCRLATYYYWIRNKIPGLGQSLYEERIILAPSLFDVEQKSRQINK